MIKLLKGKPIKERIILDLKTEVESIKSLSSKESLKEDLNKVTLPRLAIISVGDNPQSRIYIEQKKKFGLKIGVEVIDINYPAEIGLEELKDNISKICSDSKDQIGQNKVTGAILQLPLPASFSKEETQRIIDIIPLEKDVDGLTTKNQDLLNTDLGNAILPATARGIMEMLNFYNIDIKNKKVSVLGRSNLVGKPVALVLNSKQAIVTVCHSQTEEIDKKILDADILISATGKAGIINSKNIRNGQIIIDVGILVNENGKIVGDADQDIYNLNNLDISISPVPGGVGPLTVAGLFLNLLDLYKRQMGINDF